MPKSVKSYSYHSQRIAVIASWLTMAVAFCLYLITADPSVSYWDCPEYVLTASRLEIGHPPGNPFWMLAMRFATIPFPETLHPYVINIFSGLFMALAAMLLVRIIYIALDFVTRIRSKQTAIIHAIVACGASLCFSVCDSVWFSAVEAEVYAFSTFLSTVAIWLMVVWAFSNNAAKKTRLLILIAYITALSVGVHQLNLLQIPVLALIYAFRRSRSRHIVRNSIVSIGISFVILIGMLLFLTRVIPDAVCAIELFATNKLHLPINTGAMIFIFMYVAVIVTLVAISINIKQHRVSTALMMTAAVITGYSVFAIIPIRSYANPDVNEGSPSNVFAFRNYLDRSQYGAPALLYGPTPLSIPMTEETVDSAGNPKYLRFLLKPTAENYYPYYQGARIYNRSRFLNAHDSAANRQVEELAFGSLTSGYMKGDYSYTRLTSPELNMWFPRITKGGQDMMESYKNWIGMTTDNMTPVMASTTLDGEGKPAGKLDEDGERHKQQSYRPTYLQNIQMFAVYQAYYMYFRYLLWNFAGRQNDVPSTGEIDHGNFITGIEPFDNLMVGQVDLMPADAGNKNPGRNVYYCIPFILGIIGVFFLSRTSKGKRVLALSMLLFLMTGLAIVVYLNQSPGEPRERDYSFLMSYLAFCIWIGFGIFAIVKTMINNRLVKRHAPAPIAVAIIISFATPTLMATENFDDHNRSGRFETLQFANNILATTPEGIIFSYGDNFTFPLWYARQQTGRNDAPPVIDVNYLSTPGYVVSLMQGSQKIPFIAKPGDIAYNAYSFTIVPNIGDTIPLPRALRELYAQKDGAPIFTTRYVKIPVDNYGDSATIDLREHAPNGMLPFGNLMVLDIMAANSELPTPSPLYFLNGVPKSKYSPIAPYTRPSVFATVYAPSVVDSVLHINNRLNVCKAISDSHNLPYYIEPVVADAHRSQRVALLRAADHFLKSGDPDFAAEISDSILVRHPYTRIPAQAATFGDSTSIDVIEHARLISRIAETTGDTIRLRTARTLLGDFLQTSGQWAAYYSNLPPGRRPAVSNSTRWLISRRSVADSLLKTLNTQTAGF